MRVKPDLTFWSLWNISFGFLGVQIAYALQSANVSRIFSTLGANPYDLSYFWLLSPLVGIVVQPIIGALSDRTWSRMGRRIPYLFAGSFIVVLLLCLLPNSGSLGFNLSIAMYFAVLVLLLLNVGINMAMQPFKMLVGDMVNERQKGMAYSIQSFLCNVGSLVGFLFPFIFTWLGVANVAPKGVIPDSVIYSFYIGALILVMTVFYTIIKVKEMPPHEFNRFHNIAKKPAQTNLFQLLLRAPKVFWQIGLVQFFSWSAFMYMWTYTNGAIADKVWHTLDVQSVAYQQAGNWVGILFAAQAIGAALWAIVLPFISNKKVAYSLSLLLGGVGFFSTLLFSSQYLFIISYLLIGCAWGAILVMPFTILTNYISGNTMGSYLGLFNGTICVPQIIAALLGGLLLELFNGDQLYMLAFAGVLLFLGALSVIFIKPETKSS